MNNEVRLQIISYCDNKNLYGLIKNALKLYTENSVDLMLIDEELESLFSIEESKIILEDENKKIYLNRVFFYCTRLSSNGVQVLHLLHRHCHLH